MTIWKYPRLLSEIQKIAGREEAHGALGPAWGNATSESCSPWTGLLKFWRTAVAFQRVVVVWVGISDGYGTGSLSSEHQGKPILRSRCPEPIPALNTKLASMTAAREGLGSPFPSGTKTKLGEGEREEGNLNHDPVVTQDDSEITNIYINFSLMVWLRLKKESKAINRKDRSHFFVCFFAHLSLFCEVNSC